MIQVIFQVLFFFFSGGLFVSGYPEVLVEQTFSKPHTVDVTETAPARLTDFDAANPLFVLK